MTFPHIIILLFGPTRGRHCRRESILDDEWNLCIIIKVRFRPVLNPSRIKAPYDQNHPWWPGAQAHQSRLF